MIVVADTGPVNYLVLTGQVELAHDLYETLLIPPAVHKELLDPRAPTVVWLWAATHPTWVEIRPPQDSSRFFDLGPGEREAISLALETKADILLIDETAGRKIAVANNVPVKGIIGLLEEADLRHVPDFDFPKALAKLQATSIFLSEELVQAALKRYQDRHQEQQHDVQQTPEHDHGIER
jgi:predicted nucleic acid-binding protein